MEKVTAKELNAFAWITAGGLTFALMGACEIMLPNKEFAIVGMIIGLPLLFIGVKGLKKIDEKLKKQVEEIKIEE